MTLRLAEDEEVVAVPFPGGIRDAHDGVFLFSRDRGKGLLLRSISLLSEYLEDRTSPRWAVRHHAWPLALTR